MAETITVSKELLNHMLTEMEHLVEDFSLIADENNEVIQRRIKEIRENPSIGKDEVELDNFLRRKGVKIG